jgi:hypothetical protein
LHCSQPLAIIILKTKSYEVAAPDVDFSVRHQKVRRSLEKSKKETELSKEVQQIETYISGDAVDSTKSIDVFSASYTNKLKDMGTV